MRSRTVILAELTAKECSRGLPKAMAGVRSRQRVLWVSGKCRRGSTGFVGPRFRRAQPWKVGFGPRHRVSEHRDGLASAAAWLVPSHAVRSESGGQRPRRLKPRGLGRSRTGIERSTPSSKGQTLPPCLSEQIDASCPSSSRNLIPRVKATWDDFSRGDQLPRRRYLRLLQLRGSVKEISLSLLPNCLRG